MDYRREVDGLRAVAVLPVILFHAGFGLTSGGFIGVDVFFVISGYLITSIIVTELRTGGFSITRFYERRARRILPALFVVMFVCVPCAWLWLLPGAAKDFSQSLIAVSLFASNALFWNQTGYFDGAAELKPLLHTWSLAVEEQFYILYPVFLLCVWKLGKRWMFGILAACFIVSLGLAHWGSAAKPAATFYLLPARGWELLLGAFLAFHLADRGHPFSDSKVPELGATVGMLLVAFAVFCFDDQTPIPSLYTLVPTLGTALIILFGTERTFVGRLLASKMLVGIGLISYSAYLWHQPLIAFAKHRYHEPPAAAVLGGVVVLSLFLAYLSWRFVELPFRNRARFSRKTIFAFSAAGLAGFIGIGLAGSLGSAQYEALWLSQQPTSKKNAFLILDDARKRANYAMLPDGEQSDGPCRFTSERLTTAVEQRLASCREKFGKGVAVIGDSHARDLFGLLASHSETPFLFALTKGGCHPFTQPPECQYDRFLELTRHPENPFTRVIYEQAGYHLLRTPRKKGSREMFSSIPLQQEMPRIVIDRRRVDLVKSYLLDLSRHVDVVWLGSKIEPHITPSTILHLGCSFPYSLRPGQERIFRELDDYVASVAAGSALRFVSQNAALRLSFPEDFMNCERSLWSDGDHISADGEKLFGKRLDVQSLVSGTQLIP